MLLPFLFLILINQNFFPDLALIEFIHNHYTIFLNGMNQAKEIVLEVEFVNILFYQITLLAIFFSSRIITTHGSFWWMMQNLLFLRYWCFLQKNFFNTQLLSLSMIFIIVFFLLLWIHSVQNAHESTKSCYGEKITGKAEYHLRECLHIMSVSYLFIIGIVSFFAWMPFALIGSICGYGLFWATKPLMALQNLDVNDVDYVFYCAQYKKYRFFYFCVFLFFFISMLLCIVAPFLIKINQNLLMNKAFLPQQQLNIFYVAILFFLLHSWSFVWIKKWFLIFSHHAISTDSCPEDRSPVVILSYHSAGKPKELFSRKEDVLGIFLIIMFIVIFIAFIYYNIHYGTQKWLLYYNNCYFVRERLDLLLQTLVFTIFILIIQPFFARYSLYNFLWKMWNFLYRIGFIFSPATEEKHTYVCDRDYSEHSLEQSVNYHEKIIL
jgi:hypothetical protein